MLRDFLIYPYYPIIDVDIVDEKIVLTQRNSNPSRSEKWTVPLFVWDEKLGVVNTVMLLKNGTICSSAKIEGVLFLHRKCFAILDLKPGTILNYKGYSFSVVQYSAPYWEYLLKLNFTKLDEQTILGLLMDLGMDDRLTKCVICR
jgi:hypothetical protein